MLLFYRKECSNEHKRRDEEVPAGMDLDSAYDHGGFCNYRRSFPDP